jgi:hypothetical protein
MDDAPPSPGIGPAATGPGTLPQAGPAVPPVPEPGRPEAQFLPVTEPAAEARPPAPGSAPHPARAAAAGGPHVTGLPPWEITDSFLAVPQAGPGAAPAGGTATVPADGAEAFPARDSGAAQRLFPPLPGEGQAGFGAVRRPLDENAFRLFPPSHAAGRRPAAPSGEDGD